MISISYIMIFWVRLITSKLSLAFFTEIMTGVIDTQHLDNRPLGDVFDRILNSIMFFNYIYNTIIDVRTREGIEYVNGVRENMAGISSNISGNSSGFNNTNIINDMLLSDQSIYISNIMDSINDEILILFVLMASCFLINTIAKIQIDCVYPYQVTPDYLNEEEIDNIIVDEIRDNNNDAGDRHERRYLRPLIITGLYRYCNHPIWYSLFGFYCLKAYFYECHYAVCILVCSIMYDRINLLIHLEDENMKHAYQQQYEIYMQR